MNEDSPGHFLRGQTYLNKLLYGGDEFNIPNLQSPVLFAPGQRISMYKFNVYETQLSPLRPVVNQDGYYTRQKRHSAYEAEYGRSSFYKHNSWAMNYWLNNDGGHPPVSDIIEALFNKIFYERYGLTGDVEGYYIYIILISSICLFVIYYFVGNIWGRIPALFAEVSLAMYPLYFAESHFNIKDIPELSYFAISTIGFYFWVTTRKKRWSAVFFSAFFLGVGTKLNILFLPFILLAWLIIFKKSTAVRKWFTMKILFTTFGISILLFIIFVFMWPYLWDAPFQKIVEVLAFYKLTGMTDVELQSPSPFLMPGRIDLRGVMYVITMTPLLTLVLFGFGIFAMVKNRKSEKAKEATWLVWLWFAVPLLRVLLPNADVFESMRQYMEFLPAMMIIAGIGAWYVIKKLSERFFNLNMRMAWILGGIYIGYLAAILFMYHPNENVFFNILVGGPKGAAQTKLMGWQTVYDNPYRQMANWLNEHAPRYARIAFLDGTMIGLSPQFLREDIYFGSYFSGFDQKGEYIASIVYPTPPSVFPYLYLERFMNPVYEVKAGGQIIAKIWKNEPKYVKKSIHYKKIKESFQPMYGEDIKGRYWQVTLDLPEQITAIRLRSPNDECIRLSGLWQLDDYILPQRVGQDNVVTDFYFPASSAKTIRYYGLSPENCYAHARIEEITVLK